MPRVISWIRPLARSRSPTAQAGELAEGPGNVVARASVAGRVYRYQYLTPRWCEHVPRACPRQRGLPPCRHQRGRSSRGTSRRCTDTRDSEVCHCLPGLPLSPRLGYRGTLRQHPTRRQLTLHRPVHRSRRHPRNPVPALLQIPVQHRHIAARLHQHLPRLLRQLEPGPTTPLHTALTARRLHPPPARPSADAPPPTAPPPAHAPTSRHQPHPAQATAPPTPAATPRPSPRAPTPHPVLPGHAPD